ncbi:hypothetical protein T484DRAFT_1799208 [Baffinella frigidus]|nr:hypothetical protein T484DRAFT_1799208 [Cryptophyta sp. CCMP2293]
MGCREAVLLWALGDRPGAPAAFPSIPAARRTAPLPRHPRGPPAAVNVQLSGGGRGWGLVQPRAVALWAGAGGARSSVETVGVGAGTVGRTQGWARGLYYEPPSDHKMPTNFDEEEDDDPKGRKKRDDFTE